MLLVETLALAVKKYRTVVDSRRFVGLATEEEFRADFDIILSSLLGNLSECYEYREDTATFTVNVENVLMFIDVLKLLVIIKHFTNEPLLADEVIRNLFKTLSNSFKVVSSDTSVSDDRKARKKFEFFLINLYTLFWQDEIISEAAKSFFSSLSASRLQGLLLDAAPRASHEEIYHKSYRDLLVGLTSENDNTVSAIIARLDLYYPKPGMIDGLSRKDFILQELGWKTNTVYACADSILNGFEEALKAGNSSFAVQKLEHLWILLSECKFVAVDEFCATLFIFPSECEPFYKALASLKSAITKTFANLNITLEEAKILNQVNSEISSWTQKLVKALDSNYTHFERDLNNRSSQDSSKLLKNIISLQVEISNEIFADLEKNFKDDISISLTEPIKYTNEQQADQLPQTDETLTDKSDHQTVDTVVNVEALNQKGENEIIIDSVDTIGNGEFKLSDFQAESSNDQTGKGHTAIHMPTSNALTDPDAAPYWGIAITVLSTLAAFLCLREMLNPTNKA